MRTAVVCAVFPECFPLAEVEGHAALGVYYHWEQGFIGGRIEELGLCVALWVGWDIQEFGWTWRRR